MDGCSKFVRNAAFQDHLGALFCLIAALGAVRDLLVGVKRGLDVQSDPVEIADELQEAIGIAACGVQADLKPELFNLPDGGKEACVRGRLSSAEDDGIQEAPPPLEKSKRVLPQTAFFRGSLADRSEEHTSELQSPDPL